MQGVQNFGAYDDPDSYYAEHGDNLSGLRAWVYGVWIRHVLNRNVASIRGKARPSATPSTLALKGVSA